MRRMCSKSSIIDCSQRYVISILLLLIVELISHSNQQKLVNSSPTTEYSKSIGNFANENDDVDRFVRIVQPMKMTHPLKLMEQNYDGGNSVKRKIGQETTTMKRSIRHNENASQKAQQQQSISIRLNDLQSMLTELLIDEKNRMESVLGKRSANHRAFVTDLLLNEKFISRVKKFTERYILQGSSGAAALNAVLPAGRVFLFKGFKKLMWPVFIGIQVAKTVLLAMFLPSIIGSLGKMVGKGLVSVSGFGQPVETVDDFEFKDNPPIDDQMTNGMGYNYPQQNTMAVNHNDIDPNSYDTAPASNNMLSLYEMGDQQKQQFGIANTYTLPDYAQNARKEMLQSKKDDFKVFHDIPASSMLLTNYDPFYSPLLSRLDSVFQQLNLNGDNESCREKLVCLMYASPAKYMPYSNLVSAQLSRELNELRKPTSDNVEILRFFKYMRAARDGQDGKNCHNMHKNCSSFVDTEQPAMLTTFNDINKLVHARNLQ